MIWKIFVLEVDIFFLGVGSACGVRAVLKLKENTIYRCSWMRATETK